MRKHVNERFCNITEVSIKAFVQTCEQCQERKSKKVAKGIVIKPVRSSAFDSRLQVSV